VLDELFDVAVIPGAVRPMLLGLKTDEIKQMVRTEEQAWLDRFVVS